MLSAKKKSADRYLSPFAHYLSNVNPNTLTLLGSIPPLLFFVLIVSHWYILALVIYLGNGIDMVDGMIARKYHKVTRFGGFLDSIIDRFSDFLLITAFAFGGIVRWEIAAPLLLFAYLTSYIRSRGELANPAVNFATGLIERPERLVLLFISLLLYILFPSINFMSFNIAEVMFTLTAVFSLITVIQRISLAYKSL